MMIAEKETDSLIGEVVLNEIDLNNRAISAYRFQVITAIKDMARRP